MENKRKLDALDADDSGLERKKQLLDKDKSPGLEAITVSMECPATSVGAIIGKRGANVQEIMRRSGCRIVIDQSDQRDGAPKKVNLTGPPDKLAVAMSLVSLIIKDGAEALFQGEPNSDGATLQAESKCPKAKVGEVIGMKGAIIAEIMRRSSCKVRIIQDAPDGNLLERQVIYNGTAEQINEAKALVQSVIDQGASVLGMATGDNTVRRVGDSSAPITVEENIEPEKVGIVIGPKGSIIMDIMKKSGAKVVINQDFPKGQPHRIKYTGQKDQVGVAKSLVQAVMTKGPSGVAEYGNSQTSEEMNVLQKQTGKILGPQGSTIKEMQARFGVKMNIQVSESAKGGEEGAINVLRMSGTVNAVKNARQCVNFVLSGNALETYNFPSPAGYPGMGMGMGGNGGYAPPNNQNQNQFSYGKPLVPPFNGGGNQFYPPALTPSGYGQSPPMMHGPPGYGGPMSQNPPPNYGNPMGQGPMGPNSMGPNSMGQNPTPNYSAPMSQNSTPPGYRAQQQQPVPAMVTPAPQGASLGLGADGTSGILEPPVPQPDGSHSQIANVRVDVIGKIIGKAGVNITLIKTKSGASVQVVKSAVPDPNGYTKVVMAGAAPDVYLATQMIQEILVNGPSKLTQLPDKPQSSSNSYPGGPGSGPGSGASSSGVNGAGGFKAPQAQGPHGNQAYPSAYPDNAYNAPGSYSQPYPVPQGGQGQGPGQGQGQYPQQGGAMYPPMGQQGPASHFSQPSGYQGPMGQGPPGAGMPYNYPQQYQR